VSSHDHYNYLDATVIQGLQNLGHNVRDVFGYRTNYLEPKGSRPAFNEFDLVIDFVRGIEQTGAPKGAKRVFVWGEDNHVGLNNVFVRDYDHVFVRDHLSTEPGLPMNFGIESRYYCATNMGIKPFKDRSIDVCFLGQLGYGNRAEYVERLKKDFKHLNLVLGPRQFNTPDEYWSQWTKPWCAHDPEYFQTLADSKICLSFLGAGPDTGRFWECLASGAAVVAESLGAVDMVRPTPGGVKWFWGYDQLRTAITETLDNLYKPQIDQQFHWQWNRDNHSTTARAQYLLRECGFKG
jgi:hypothetical protein